MTCIYNYAFVACLPCRSVVNCCCSCCWWLYTESTTSKPSFNIRTIRPVYSYSLNSLTTPWIIWPKQAFQNEDSISSWSRSSDLTILSFHLLRTPQVWKRWNFSLAYTLYMYIVYFFSILTAWHWGELMCLTDLYQSVCHNRNECCDLQQICDVVRRKSTYIVRQYMTEKEWAVLFTSYN
jgi:hypothetical protein